MHCPFCNSNKTNVRDSRVQVGCIRRKRFCLNCEKKFTTIEILCDRKLQVIKKSGAVEDFDQEKILASIIYTAKKSKLTYEKREQILQEILSAIDLLQSVQIKTTKIIEIILSILAKKDKELYIKFGTLYNVFNEKHLFCFEQKS